MERIFEISERLTANLPDFAPRYLYGRIEWSDRMIMIKGSRGVGKTTMLCQRCKEIGGGGLYASLDNLYFNDHSISEVGWTIISS